MAKGMKKGANRPGPPGANAGGSQDTQLLLQNLVAVVTGGARGIGRAISEELARHGADVAVVDMGDATATVKAVGELGRKALAFKADVTSFGDAQTITDRVIDRLGARHPSEQRGHVPVEVDPRSDRGRVGPDRRREPEIELQLV
jgi:NAD(P)-dependent dehydrogenase (short-subunit alcohol dehydrogenase family)